MALFLLGPGVLLHALLAPRSLTRLTDGSIVAAFGQVIAASYGSQLTVMTMTAHERGAAALLILSAAVNVVASIVFISMLGLTGAAIATTIVLIVWKVATAFFIARHLRLLPGVLGMFGSTLRRSLGSRL